MSVWRFYFLAVSRAAYLQKRTRDINDQRPTDVSFEKISSGHISLVGGLIHFVGTVVMVGRWNMKRKMTEQLLRKLEKIMREEYII